MIPVEYTAGGTALCAHHKSERTPDKHAYKVAYVKKNRNHKQYPFINDTAEIQNSDDRYQHSPQDHHHIRRGGGGGDVFFESLAVDLFTYRLKAVGKELLRSQGYLVFYGNDLKYHIDHPYHPQYVENRKGFEKIHSLKDAEAIRP